MSAPVSHLTELPVEILEQILLHLPGQDVIKMEAVWGALSNFVRCLTLWLCGLGQSTLAGYFMQFARPSLSTRAIFCWPVRQSPCSLRFPSASEIIRGVCTQVVRCSEGGEECSRIALANVLGISHHHNPWGGSSRFPCIVASQPYFRSCPVGRESKADRMVEYPSIPFPDRDLCHTPARQYTCRCRGKGAVRFFPQSKRSGTDCV